MGYRVRNATCRAFFEEIEEPISEAVAGRDFRQLVDAGLLIPMGERRGRYHLRSPELRSYREAIVQARDPRDDSDPSAAAA